MGTKFSQMGPRWNPYWRTGIAHMGPTWVLGAKLYGAHMGMSIRDPYYRTQMMPIWDVPHFPHTLPTIFPDGPQVEPILANWDRPCGPHMGLGCKILWDPYGRAHMGPIFEPRWDPHETHMGLLPGKCLLLTA